MNEKLAAMNFARGSLIQKICSSQTPAKYCFVPWQVIRYSRVNQFDVWLQPYHRELNFLTYDKQRERVVSI